MLVVSEVCAVGYGAERVRARSASGAVRVVDRSAARAAARVAKEKVTLAGRHYFLLLLSLDSACISLSGTGILRPK
jgi:hypothetical protein